MRKEEIMALPELARDYLRYISVVQNRSAATVSEYASDLRTFFRFLKASRFNLPMDDCSAMDLSDIDEHFIRTIGLNDAYEFLYYCKNERLNDAPSRARKTSAIRQFFQYLTNNKGILEVDPMANLDSPKLKKSLPKYLSVEESKRLLSSAGGKYKERDFCIITLFLNCGMRLSELVGLNLSSIKSNHSMTVTGKGNKERTVYLNDACVSALDAYLAVRPRDGVVDRNALFLSARKRRISPKTVQYIIKTDLEKAGLGGAGYSTHKLRHTAATLMYQTGSVDILTIKEILGHENLNTTQIYTHTNNEQLRQAVDRNPLSSIQAPKGSKPDDSER